MDLLNLLGTFVALAEHGTVSRAADALNYAQPTVSMHIKALQQYYGVPLFEFRKKRYVLTDEGEVLHGYARAILHLAQEAMDAIGEFKTCERGSLRVGATSNVGVYVLPRILSTFRQRFPGISVSVLIDRTRVIATKVCECELNVGIVEAEVEENHRITVEPWIKDRLVLIVSPEDAWASRDRIRPDELVDRPFVAGERGSGTRRILDRELGEVSRKINVALELGSTEAVKRAVESNLGVSIVTESSVYREVRLGALRCIPIDGVEMHKTFSLIYPSSRYLTAATRRFLSVLRGMKETLAVEVVGNDAATRNESPQGLLHALGTS
ncbi:MAG: LysR family transcriptional regulator [Bacillota bacterium]